MFLSLQINKVCFDSSGIMDSEILAQASVSGIYCGYDSPINWTLYICVWMTMTSLSDTQACGLGIIFLGH